MNEQGAIICLFIEMLWVVVTFYFPVAIPWVQCDDVIISDNLADVHKAGLCNREKNLKQEKRFLLTRYGAVYTISYNLCFYWSDL